MNNLWAEENYIDATRHVGVGDSGVFETFTSDRGELYRALQREYGRCTSKVYIDQSDGSVKAIGWVFQKRKKYDDCNETYLLETWVTLHEKPPTKTIQYHYAHVR